MFTIMQQICPPQELERGEINSRVNLLSAGCRGCDCCGHKAPVDGQPVALSDTNIDVDLRFPPQQ